MQDVPVEKLGLSGRSYNCLRRAGIFFLSQLMSLRENDLTEMRNMGAKSVAEVLDFQKKIKEQLGCSIINLDLCLDDNCCPYIEELMIHKAFPHFLGKNIKEIRFRDIDGLLVLDISINDLKLSVRTTNAMNNNNITSMQKIANMTYSSINEMKNMGAKSVNELILYLRENAEVIIEGEEIKDIAEDLYMYIENKCLQEKPEFPIHIFARNIKLKLCNYRNNTYEGNSCELIIESQEFTREIFKNDEFLKDMQQYFLAVIWDEKEISLRALEDRVPSLFLRGEMCLTAINNLVKMKKIEMHNEIYRIRLQYLDEWIGSLKDSQRQTISLRLQDKTLEECGNVLGITRERVRQIIAKALKGRPILREDDYAYWFREYQLDYEAMHFIFDINKMTYMYYTIAYKQGEKSIDDMESDEKITQELYVNLQKYINRNSIFICGEYVPCKRDLICRKLAQILCSEMDMSFEEFYGYYLELLRENELDDNEKLLFPSERAFEARMQDSQYVLMKYGRKFRYYPINEYDIREFVFNLHLEQFKNVEISTLKLYSEYRELMKEYNIADEYELHNLLKKTEKIWNEDMRYDIAITRMPFLSFGNVDRAKQTKELLFMVAPVSLEEFAEYYEMEYGVLKQTVMANMTPYISTFYHEGYYSINQPRLDKEEFNYMKGELIDDFYFIDDVKELFTKKYGNMNMECMNPRTYKELGFKVYRGYLIRSTYLSADEYFTKEFTKNKLLDMNNYDSRLAYIQSSYQALDNLKANYELIEYEEKKYISYTHFSSVAENITKDIIEKYVEDAITIGGDEEFFTIKSLKKKGFDSELHQLGFGDWFNASLLKNSKKIRYVRTGNGVIFSKQKSQVTTVDFIRYIMNNVRKMDINEFIEYIEDNYGISYAKDKLVLFVKDSEMYYNSTMEKIYATKEEFYDDF